MTPKGVQIAEQIKSTYGYDYVYSPAGEYDEGVGGLYPREYSRENAYVRIDLPELQVTGVPFFDMRGPNGSIDSRGEVEFGTFPMDNISIHLAPDGRSMRLVQKITKAHDPRTHHAMSSDNGIYTMCMGGWQHDVSQLIRDDNIAHAMELILASASGTHYGSGVFTGFVYKCPCGHEGYSHKAPFMCNSCRTYSCPDTGGECSDCGTTVCGNCSASQDGVILCRNCYEAKLCLLPECEGRERHMLGSGECLYQIPPDTISGGRANNVALVMIDGFPARFSSASRAASEIQYWVGRVIPDTRLVSRRMGYYRLLERDEEVFVVPARGETWSFLSLSKSSKNAALTTIKDGVQSQVELTPGNNDFDRAIHGSLIVGIDSNLPKFIELPRAFV